MELTTEKRCIDLGYLSIGIGHSPLVKRIEFRQYSTTKDVNAIDCILQKNFFSIIIYNYNQLSISTD